MTTQSLKVEFGSSKVDISTYVFGNDDNDHALVDILNHYLSVGRYYGKDKQQAQDAVQRYKTAYPKGKPKRALFGYINPPHKSKIGLSLLEDGANTSFDSDKWSDKEDWLMSPSRNFTTYSPTSRTQDANFTQGHHYVVFGHNLGASQHFNTVGHTQTVNQNKQWNQQKTTYHGLENYKKSAKSGSLAPTYMIPSQKSGSNPMYWDKKNPDFDEEFQKK